MKLSTLFLFFPFFVLAQNNAVYVSDAGNFHKPPWQIVRFFEDGSDPRVYINEFLNWPQDILFLEEENEVLISNLGSGCINVHNRETGRFLRSFACGILGPTRMAFGEDGLLYVLQWTGPGKVLRYTREGEPVDEFTNIPIPQAIGMAWDESGDFFVSSYSKDCVLKFNSEGEFVDTLIDSNLEGPTNIWFDEDGDLLVSDYDGTAVKRFDANGEYKGEFLSNLSKSEGYVQLSNGNYLIGDGASSSIKMYSQEGETLGDFTDSTDNPMLNPNALVYREERMDITLGLDVQIGKLFIGYNMPNLDSLVIQGPLASEVRSIIIHDSQGEPLSREEFHSPIYIANLPIGKYYLTCILESGNTSTFVFYRSPEPRSRD